MFLRLLLPACALAANMLCTVKANAQTDSSYFDLGRIKLQKNLTQHITVKGGDLQKQPFLNLTQAVNVWFYGTFSNTGTLVYVVDGVLLTDVNQYPVQDIEEVTLIQNAGALLNGLKQDQQLVLVKTKRNKLNRQGIFAETQFNIVQLPKSSYQPNLGINTKTKFESDYFQQYYLSAYKNSGSVHSGVSVSYQRDVLPKVEEMSGDNYISREKIALSRFKFNGYLNAGLWKGTVVDITAGYVPQKANAQYTKTMPYFNGISDVNSDIKYYANLYNTTINLTSKILPGLNNVLRGAYNYTTITDTSLTISSGITNYNGKSIRQRRNAYVLYDELSYTKYFGLVRINPSVNFNYQHVKDSTNKYDIAGNTSSTNSIGYSSSSLTFRTKLYFLTPQIDITFLNAINLNGGLTLILNSTKEIYNREQVKKSFPYGSITADLLRLIDSTNTTTGLKVFGSYALHHNYNITGTILPDINNYISSSSDISYQYFSNSSAAYKYYKTLNLGTQLSLFDNQLEIGYNFEKRKSSYLFKIDLFTPTVPSSIPVMYLANADFNIHRVSVNYRHNFNQLNWEGNINISNTITDVDLSDIKRGLTIKLAKKVYTGGFINRFKYHNVRLAADVIYLTGVPKDINPYDPGLNKVNALSLQNAYASLLVKSKRFNHLEIYVNGNHLTGKNQASFTNYRRFFGLGVKAGL